MGHCSAITGEPGLKRTESSLHWYSVGLVSVFYYYVGPNLLGPTVIRVVDFGSCWHAHVWCLVSLSPGLLLSHETPGLRLSVAFPSHTSHSLRNLLKLDWSSSRISQTKLQYSTILLPFKLHFDSKVHANFCFSRI